MNREEALQKSEEALQDLALDLQSGKSESLIKYLDVMGRFHRYSFGNCMLIAMQKPDATIVAGFGHWKKLGRFVKKGERGIGILAPLISKRKADDDNAEDEKTKRVFGFRVVHVFDVSQTEGKELPELRSFTGDPGKKLQDLEEVVRGKDIELQYEPIAGGALGVSSGGKITVLPGLEAAEQFSVLAHELAHEMLHRGDRRKDTTKIIRETEAEAVAYAVSRAVGLNCSTGSSDYIKLWNGDNEVLMQSLDLIRDVASSIITDLEQVGARELQYVA
ncbi:ArdC-like ssDNA-binding domain-containing protein [Crateriforma conspicua]|uniref:ArdC-like ssDNA-binding domain-containing protein n=1 Tax=Crateriforma conspicua TaxID=2527996 RepID=UPI001187C8E9|nr:ArdC-like ssDNA-binding domain-containing protein [Crateriforma conspicua]QDV62026.1 hypothetical protein Mal65_11540 [Crateriforma conspicua]